jgi:hypothetical protein
VKILCLGNADNVGIRLYSWMKEAGHDLELYRLAVDEEPKRGNPYLYLPKEKIDEDPNIHLIKDSLLRILWVSVFGSKRVDYINKNFDFVIITSGYHALSLSGKIHLPKVLLPIGQEIHFAAFRGISKLANIFTHPRHLIRNYLYRWLSRKALSAVDTIFEPVSQNTRIIKSLGLEKKIAYIALGEDVQKNRELVNQEKLSELNRETQCAKRVFLWFTRLTTGVPNRIGLQGSDLFFESLENFKEELKTGELIVYMTRHGHGTHLKDFFHMASMSEVYPYIRWTDHLSHPDLMTYLSIKNAVLFAHLKHDTGISGIGRDGYAIGVPLVSSSTDKNMMDQYMVPGPRIYAKEPAEIISAMTAFLNMGEEEFKNIRRETAVYGKKYIDKSFFLKRLYKEIESLTCDSNLTLPSEQLSPVVKK